MGKPTGFLEFKRELPPLRKPEERVEDFKELELPWADSHYATQAARCMDCGVPGCHSGCPLGNLIPDWNDLVFNGDWEKAVAELHRTNNFPEVTGRVCPAPCETTCILGINEPPVAIKAIEKVIAEKGWAMNLLAPQPAAKKSWKRVAVVGSGPAGLAAAQQLARLGHIVTVFEKDARVGGLLTYGIPDFKLDKSVIFRRAEQMREEGVVFKTSTEVGKDISADELLKGFDAVLLAGGAQQPRDLPIPGRELAGVHFAMEFLGQQNRRVQGDIIPEEESILATGKRVVVIGGGDTGSDCVGTSNRHGAASIHQFEILPKPENPKTSTSHEEGCERRWSVLTKSLTGENGQLAALHGVEVEWLPPAQPGGRPEMREKPGTEFTMPVDQVFLAMGFTGPIRQGLLAQLGVKLDERGNVARDAAYKTSLDKVFVAGDMGRGQSLVVWAIWEGRQAAASVHRQLMGR